MKALTLYVYMNVFCLPDGSRCVPLVPPLFGWVDVHAPQLPIVAVARVLIALQLERVVLDVVDGRQDNPRVVLFDSGQNRLGPEDGVHTSYTHHTNILKDRQR